MFHKQALGCRGPVSDSDMSYVGKIEESSIRAEAPILFASGGIRGPTLAHRYRLAELEAEEKYTRFHDNLGGLADYFLDTSHHPCERDHNHDPLHVYKLCAISNRSIRSRKQPLLLIH